MEVTLFNEGNTIEVTYWTVNPHSITYQISHNMT